MASVHWYTFALSSGSCSARRLVPARPCATEPSPSLLRPLLPRVAEDRPCMPGAPEPEDDAAVEGAWPGSRAARPGSCDPSSVAELADLLRLANRSASSRLAIRTWFGGGRAGRAVSVVVVDVVGWLVVEAEAGCVVGASALAVSSFISSSSACAGSPTSPDSRYTASSIRASARRSRSGLMLLKMSSNLNRHAAV